ncbi:fungal-specific transcription factor domain-containing protein [Lophiotrema nucula]|uniref:Fungal-specific transcription factor domain-containing protein n=1 Tax=Lophiotrema nucula TaxID=690887 RepID=A0A6A5Z4H4_9PLEO|nr:fungal-specific transcription factor domain-containing protein [Lophiotrema nucula]
MSEQDLYRPIKRIRQACQNCRRKKARCTGERPECAFCVRLGQACSYADDDGKDTSEKSNSDTRKNGESPDNDLSERLSALENQMADVAQTVRGIASTLQNISRSIASSNPGVSQGVAVVQSGDTAANSSPYTGLPPIEQIRNAVELYFKYCHNQPYSLFHENSLRNKVETDELPAHLQFALLASTVRYSTDPFFEDKVAAVSAYASQSWKSIVMPWNGIQSENELTIVQTILLLAIIDYTDGRTQASWIKVGLAIRLAQDFRLMAEPDKELSPIQQEERRRVFWSFYLCDKLISCGRERPAAILDDQCKLQLPGDENEWRAGNYQQTPTLDELTDEEHASVINTLSPFAIAVVMGSLLGRCAQYALGEQEEVTPGGKTLPWNPRSKYSSIHSSLLHVESELGLNETLSAKIAHRFLNADGTVDQHRAAPLVLSHALFFLCQCLLYHPFLLRQRLTRIGQRTPQSFLAQSFHACRSAATSLSRLMDDVKSLGCETLSSYYDPFYGYCTMVAGTIHSMYLQHTDPLIVETATASFESSMQNLLDLSFFWKSCGMMRSRLEDFRGSSVRYTQLVDPTVHEVHLSASDANDLVECLDYSRMSTTPRRKSENTSTSQLAALSQLPSPFFEEFVNLLPFSYSRPVSVLPNDDFSNNWANPPPIFDTNIFPTSTSAPFSSNPYASFHPGFPTTSMSAPEATSTSAPAASSNASFSPSSSYSIGISPGRRESFSHRSSVNNNYTHTQQNNETIMRKLSSPRITFKRPWYEASS